MAYIFKIKLEGSSKPPIWRKVKVNENLTFLDMHLITQGVFNWQNTHLFQFSPNGWGSTPRLQQKLEGEEGWDEVPFSKSNTWPYNERYDANKIKLKEYFKQLKQKIVYIYDFGDDWKHSIELVEITDETIIVPLCLGGKGTAPIEDCGGIWGYYNMVEALNDKKHPDNKDFREWLDFEKNEKWDLNEFDLKDVQERLRDIWALEKE
ncbi:plasmid pRiA4b ORF-3 family protein [Mariniflexile ostreae]|uniref:Plasmid pRiA4b ORF-3 family protein n=1 Tax=Mariniflexile ostreae TaxID=1520892 RepID=A0ABV5F7D5_9FLAO